MSSWRGHRPSVDLKNVLALMRSHSLQSRRMASLATKLRLSQLSRYTRDAEGATIAARNAPAVLKNLAYRLQE